MNLRNIASHRHMLISREYVKKNEGVKRKVDIKKRLLIFTNTDLLTNITTEVSCCSFAEAHQATNYSFVIITSNKGCSRRKKDM